MSHDLCWGDLHCHTGLSYGLGTSEAALANGLSHIDFVALIGHAFWPDMVVNAADLTGWISRHFGGFEKLRRFGPRRWNSSSGRTDPMVRHLPGLRMALQRLRRLQCALPRGKGGGTERGGEPR